MIGESANNKLIIGSYPYRGNVNICRIACEYVGMPYSNMFFNPCSWKIYKDKNTDNWTFQELPFLIDGDIVVTQVFAMCEYIIKKSGRMDLLGVNPEDSYIVDGFLWGKDLIQSLLSLIVQHKNDPKRLMEQMHNSWIKKIRVHLVQYENNARSTEFYLGYISVIDFIVYQIFEHYKDIFQKEIYLFPKLLSIRGNVAKMEIVKQFQKSDRIVKEICPLQFYKKWKLEMMKSGPVPHHSQNNLAG